MKLPCEIAVKSVVPAIRALLAKELIVTFGINQTEAANLLGITQTAVSKYVHNVRGSRMEIESEEKVAEHAKQTAAELASGRLGRSVLKQRICTTCKIVRETSLMCKLCMQADSVLKKEKCEVCLR